MMPSTVDHAIALIRIVVGLLLMGHGAQMLFGWFGGLLFALGLLTSPAALAMRRNGFAWSRAWCHLGGRPDHYLAISLAYEAALITPDRYVTDA